MRILFALLIASASAFGVSGQAWADPPECETKDQVVKRITAIDQRIRALKLDAEESAPLVAALNDFYASRGAEPDAPGSSYVVTYMDDFPVAKIFIFLPTNCYSFQYTLYPKDEVFNIVGKADS